MISVCQDCTSSYPSPLDLKILQSCFDFLKISFPRLRAMERCGSSPLTGPTSWSQVCTSHNSGLMFKWLVNIVNSGNGFTLNGNSRMYFASRPTDGFEADAYWQVIKLLTNLEQTKSINKDKNWSLFDLQIPLMDKEFSYSVDVSNVGCHCNAAAYFIDMPGEIQKIYIEQKKLDLQSIVHMILKINLHEIYWSQLTTACIWHLSALNFI